jgi:glycosyltransferase involved in cell wall biosynthesis
VRITILHRYFWPQNYPYALMLRDISESLAEAGHHVSVLTTQQGSNEEKHQREDWSSGVGIPVDALVLGSEKRKGLLRKALNAVYFGLWIFFRLLTGRQDMVMVATTPPVVVAALVRWCASLRGFRYVYHCQDIHPEAMLINGHVGKGWAYRRLLALDKKNVESAWRVITLSQDMCDTFHRRGNRTDHVRVINNFVFEGGEALNDSSGSGGRLCFLFAGSLGRLQNLELLIDSLRPFRDDPRVEFVFMGDGVLLNRLRERKEQLGLANVEFTGQRPVEEAVKAMQAADVGIVSLSQGICQVAYPSKSVMYLGNGLPVLALVDESTELARFINENYLGLAVSPSSADDVSQAIERMITMCLDSPVSRAHVRALAKQNFGRRHILRRFVGVFDEK